MNCKVCQRKQPWCHLRLYSYACFKRLRKTSIKLVGEQTQFQPGRSEYKDIHSTATKLCESILYVIYAYKVFNHFVSNSSNFASFSFFRLTNYPPCHPPILKKKGTNLIKKQFFFVPPHFMTSRDHLIYPTSSSFS